MPLFGTGAIMKAFHIGSATFKYGLEAGMPCFIDPSPRAVKTLAPRRGINYLGGNRKRRVN